VLALLEDVGYMPALLFMVRFMHLNGPARSELPAPVFLGFGCNVPAVMGARNRRFEAGALLTIVVGSAGGARGAWRRDFRAPLFLARRQRWVGLGLVAVSLIVLAVTAC